MQQSIYRIDKYTPISENLAMAGQPSENQFKAIRDAGFQLVIRLRIREIESVIENEEKMASRVGLLFEEIPISVKSPTQEAFDTLAETLNKYQRLKTFLHCTAGYCTSGLLIPYLVLYQNMTRDEATSQMIVQAFDATWTHFIDNIMETHEVDLANIG